MKFLVECTASTRKPPTGRRVAVVGAGPAGLGAAGVLACRGHEVHVYDALPEPGGLLIFGIPPERMPRESVRRGVAELRGAGVVFLTSTFISCGAQPQREHVALLFAQRLLRLEELAREYDAVIIATGAWRSRALRVPGSDLPGVYSALDFIVRARAHQLGYLPREQVLPVGRRVLVIGGGLVAVDAALEAAAQGAREVIVAYRRTAGEAPAGRHMIELLKSRGIKFLELVTPVAFTGRDRVERVRFVRVRLGAPDSSGRPAPEPVPGSEFDEAFDTVLLAVGELPTPPGLCLGVELGPDSAVRVDERMRAGRGGVFAAGDVVTGPSTVGMAFSSGVRAARYVDEYLSGVY